MPPSVLSRNCLQNISEYQCIDICRKGHVWSLRGSQLHALFIFLPERSPLFLTIHWNKQAIHTVKCFSVPQSSFDMFHHCLYQTVSLPYDKIAEMRQDFFYNSFQSSFELIAHRINPVCRQVLLHTSVGKSMVWIIKKNIDQMRVNNIKQK